MFKRALFISLVVALAAGCPKKKDNPPPPPATFGPSAIAGGNNALLMQSGDMLTWSEIPQATSGITATGDIVKIVKVPNTNRVVAIVRITGTDLNDEIWYNDNGGDGAWTEAKFTDQATEDYAFLDPEHRPGGVQDEWTLTDIHFVSATTGYAVGYYYLILWTWDGGATWKGLNAYQGATPATVEFQEIDLGASIPAEFIVGAQVQNADNSHNGRIIAVDEYWSVITVDVTNTTAFTAGDSIQVGAAGTPVAGPTIDNTNIWMVPAYYPLCVWATAAATGEHTVNFGLSNYTSSCGAWKFVSDAPATPDARTFVFSGPPISEQEDTGELGDYAVNGFFFFDATTGVAGTNNGVWYTTDGGADWTQFTGTGTDAYHFFTYSQGDLASDGYLYSINDSTTYNLPGRTAVTYSAGAWSFGTTPAWVEHATAANVDMYYVDGAYSIFFYDGKIFVADDSSGDGVWGHCSDPNNATLDNTFWQDTYEQYLGGTLANGDNPAYDKGVLDGTGAPTGTIRTICKR